MTPLKSIILYLVDNAEQLARDKFSGVHDVDDRYTVHVDSFVPRVMLHLYTNSIIEKTVKAVSKTYVEDVVIYDSYTGWLTIRKAK